MSRFHRWEDVERELFDDAEIAAIKAGAAKLVAAYRAARQADTRRKRR